MFGVRVVSLEVGYRMRLMHWNPKSEEHAGHAGRAALSEPRGGLGLNPSNLRRIRSAEAFD